VRSLWLSGRTPEWRQECTKNFNPVNGTFEEKHMVSFHIIKDFEYLSLSLNGARESGPNAAKYCTLGTNWTSAI